jgi:hypothetical protein
MARLTSDASQAPPLHVVVDEVVNFGLRGIFYDRETAVQSPEEHSQWAEQ